MSSQQEQLDSIDVSKIREKKLFVATPMYGGMCTGFYTKACIDLQQFCDKYGIKIVFYYLFNESLITRARNYCVDEFLRSDCTHMMFIDSDIHFKEQDVIKLLSMCDSEKGYDIVTAPYPKKCIAWEKVAEAVKQGFADENPHVLQDFGGDYVFNPVGNNTSFSLGNPVEISEGGTGFMMIDRSVFVDYAYAYPQFKYRPDHLRSEHFDGENEITAFFDCVIDPETKRYLSEDYMFSRYARKIGKKIWLCPWIKLNHIGTTSFVGNMAAIAAIQATPTADNASKAHASKKKKLNKAQKKALKKQKRNLTNLS